MTGSLSKPKLKRELRRRRHQWAWVTLEGKTTVHDCRVFDVSQNGAKVVIDVAAEIGTRFGLALVPHRPRQCEIAWRRGRTLGINSCPEFHSIAAGPPFRADEALKTIDEIVDVLLGQQFEPLASGIGR